LLGQLAAHTPEGFEWTCSLIISSEKVATTESSSLPLIRDVDAVKKPTAQNWCREWQR
jgi:hypothetical protein